MSGLSISTKQRAASEPRAMLRGPPEPMLIAALSAWRPEEWVVILSCQGGSKLLILTCNTTVTL